MLITVPCMRTVRFKTQVTAAVRSKSLKLVVTFPLDECHGSPDDLKNTCPCHCRGDTLKNPHCSITLFAENNGKICSLSLTISTFSKGTIN